MAKTAFAKKLDIIQAEAHTYLRQVGYRKKGRTFNKSLDSGLIHVVNFQMGRRSLSGQFTINLGIFIPEIYKLLWFWEEDEPKFVDHGDCEIINRIGDLKPSSEDLWWDLKKNTRRLSKTIMVHLDKYGLPYLNKLNTQEDIIQEWNKHGDTVGFNHRSGLSVAILLAKSGQEEKAQSLLINEYELHIDEPYAEFVSSIAKKLDISLERNI